MNGMLSLDDSTNTIREIGSSLVTVNVTNSTSSDISSLTLVSVSGSSCSPYIIYNSSRKAGIALKTITAGGTGQVAISGVVTGFAGLLQGSIYYASSSGITTTLGTEIVGVALNSTDLFLIPTFQEPLQLTFSITTSSSSWTINHNLDKIPVILVLDGSGNLITPSSISYPNLNSAVVNLTSAINGIIYLQ